MRASSRLALARSLRSLAEPFGTRPQLQRQPAVLSSSSIAIHHGVLSADGVSARYFSSSNEHIEPTEHAAQDANKDFQPRVPPRPWMDVRVPLDVRVQKLLYAPIGSLDRHVPEFDAPKLVQICCFSKQFKGINAAHNVLERMLAERRHHNSLTPQHKPFPVPIEVFQQLMYALTLMASEKKIVRARMRELLDLLLSEVAKDEEDINNGAIVYSDEYGNNTRVLPTVDIFNIVLLGLRNAAQLDAQAAREAHTLLGEMTNIYEKLGWHVKPNTKSFTHVISAYAKCGHKSAGKKAESILRLMQQVHEQEKQAYLEEYGESYDASDEAVNRRKIVTPDEVTYTAVISAYRNSYSLASAKKVRDLLVEIYSLKDASAKVDGVMFIVAIDTLGRVASNKKYAPAGRIAAAGEAEALVWTMVDAMAAYMGHDEDTPQKGGKITPEQVMMAFNACMNAYVKCGSLEGVYKVEALFQQQLSSSLDRGVGDMQPTVITFNTVLNAWTLNCKSLPDAPKKAEDLLKQQLELTSSGRLSESAKPNCASFAIVMKAYAKSEYSDKVHHAHRLLKQLLSGIADGHVTVNKNPNVPFTTLLNAVAFSPPASASESTPTDAFTSEKDDDVYTIALQTYRELKEDTYQIGAKPDHMDFAAMLQATAVHTAANSAERRQMTRVVFEDACYAGWVSFLVIKALRKCCPDKQMLGELLKSDKLAISLDSVDWLPRAWTYKVDRKFRWVRNTVGGSTAADTASTTNTSGEEVEPVQVDESKNV